MVSSIKSRKVPATLAIIPTIFPGLYGGNYKKIATLLVDESLLVIRPDHIIAWRVSKMSMLDSNILDEAVSKITGVDQMGNLCMETFVLLPMPILSLVTSVGLHASSRFLYDLTDSNFPSQSLLTTLSKRLLFQSQKPR